MNDHEYKKTLADLRTISAIKRNHLAEERTAFAELRTGLAIVVISPSILTIFSIFVNNPFLEIINLVFFIAMTIIGVVISLHARNWLTLIQKKKVQIAKSMEELLEANLEIKEKYSQLISEYLED
jgi:uncharacterized membrane protein YidH (DUF202 family)